MHHMMLVADQLISDVKTVLEACSKYHPGVTILVLGSEFAVVETYVSACRNELISFLEELVPSHNAAIADVYSQSSEEKEPTESGLTETSFVDRAKSGSKAKGKKVKKGLSDDEDDKSLDTNGKSRQASAAAVKKMKQLQKLEFQLIEHFESNLSSELRKASAKLVIFKLH